MLEVDLHSHTLHSSCGNHTVLEMIDWARRKGLKGFAITDHGPALGKKITTTFFERFQNPFRDIRLLKGMECNLLENGDIDLPKNYLKWMDVVLLGIHHNLPKNQSADYYTERLIKAIETNPCIDIITHPNDENFPLHFKEVARTARKFGMALELNNSKTALNVVNPETTRNLVRACKEEGCQLVINGDAHAVTELGENEAVLPYLEELHFPENLWVNRTADSAYAFIEWRRKNKTS